MFGQTLVRCRKPISRVNYGRMMGARFCQRSIDQIPGTLEPASPNEIIRAVTDDVRYWDEQWIMAKQDGLSSPMMKMNLFGLPSVALLSHDCVKEWHQYELTGKARRDSSSTIAQLIGRPFEDMFGSTHSAWRKKVMPSFKPNMIGRLSPFIQHSVQNLLLEYISSKTKEGESVQFCTAAKRFAFEVGSKFVYGPLLNNQEREYAFDIFQRWANGFGPKAVGQALHSPDDPDTEWAAAKRAKIELSEYIGVKHLEAEQLTASNTWDSTYGDDADCLTRSLMECDGIFAKDDYTLSDRVDSMLFITFAAYDTSATAITNMIYSMWQNPEETEKVREAVMNHPELSNPDTVFTFDMLKSCNEMECFINESMRLHSFSSTMAPRIVHDEEGVVIGGYHLPKGMGIIIPLKFLMSGEGSWTDPLEFRPSRFDKSNGESKADRGSIGSYNHVPFATGLHKCLGMHLAMMEMRMYTTMLLRDYEFELDESKLNEEGTVNHMNLTQSFPHYNVYLKLKRRN